MIIYFADRSMNILGQASTGLPKGLLISGDKKTEEIKTGTKNFEFDLDFTDRATAEAMTAPGNYILRAADGEGEFYTIIDAEIDLAERVVMVYAEDAGLNMLNEVVGDYSASSAMSIEAYFVVFGASSGFEVGINEISDRTRTLEWTGESTLSARLLSLATQFDAELSFSFEIDKLSIVHKYVNFWKSRGKSTGKILRIGQHIANLRIKKTVANLATSLLVKGDNITLSGYSYDDGDIYIDGEYLKSRTAIAAWGEIAKVWSYKTSTQSELCNRAVTQLKKIYQTEVTYEAEVLELPKNVQVGDTVRIADEEGKHYIDARIVKMVTEVGAGKRDITLTT